MFKKLEYQKIKEINSKHFTIICQKDKNNKKCLGCKKCKIHIPKPKEN